jgi:hypothetical protein
MVMLLIGSLMDKGGRQRSPKVMMSLNRSLWTMEHNVRPRKRFAGGRRFRTARGRFSETEAGKSCQSLSRMAER